MDSNNTSQALEALTPSNGEAEARMKAYAEKLRKKYPHKNAAWLMKKVANHFKVVLVDDKGNRLNPGSTQKIHFGVQRHRPGTGN